MAQPSLEQYVANRYMNDMQQAGYQPVCQNAEEMLEDALKIKAALNQATLFIKQNVMQRRAAT